MADISILSIDFDYFQDVTLDVLKEYPDGLDITGELSTLIWSSKYAIPYIKDKLETVKPLENELRILENIIQKQDTDTDVLITSSRTQP